MKQKLHLETLKTLYYCFIYPYFEYCLEVWGAAAQTNLDIIIKIQKKIVRIVKSVPPRTHTKPLFKELHFLTVDKLYIYKVMSFMYKYNCNCLPNVFNSMFTNNEDIHNYDTRQSRDLHLPIMRILTTQKTIRFMGVKIWNIMKINININLSIMCVKKLVKKYLLNTNTPIFTM